MLCAAEPHLPADSAAPGGGGRGGGGAVPVVAHLRLLLVLLLPLPPAARHGAVRGLLHLPLRHRGELRGGQLAVSRAVMTVTLCHAGASPEERQEVLQPPVWGPAQDDFPQVPGVLSVRRGGLLYPL